MRPLKEEKESKGRGRPSSVWFDPTSEQPQSQPDKEAEKVNENSDMVFNPVSPDWYLRKLIKRGAHALKSFAHQVPSSYIYIIGDTGINPIYMKSKGFYDLKSNENRRLENQHHKRPLFSFPQEAYT